MTTDDPPQEPTLIEAPDFRAALDAMQDHVAIGRAIRRSDGSIEDFEILYMNAPTVDGAGRRPADLVGGRVRELFPAWERYGFFERFVHLVDVGEPLVVERFHYEDVTPEGVPMEGWWSVSAARLGDGYISATRDVTAAVRAERARHAEQRRQEQSRLAVELLQRASLPRSLPHGRFEVGARYEPAMEGQPVGGDWYDAFELDEHRLGLVVGDVSGHGPEAAATMVQVRNALRAYAHEHPDPSTAVDHVDAMLAASTEHELFATCIYGVLDAEAGTFSWANAGHLPPLLIGGTATLLDGSELVGLAPQRIADALIERLIGRSDDVAVVAARFGAG